jgi:Cys-rich protein (TIGR01571 family)
MAFGLPPSPSNPDAHSPLCPDNYRRAFNSWYIPHLLIFIAFTSIWFWVAIAGYVRCLPYKPQLPLPPPGMSIGSQFNLTALVPPRYIATAYPPPVANATANATSLPPVTPSPPPFPTPAAPNATSVYGIAAAYNAAIASQNGKNATYTACNKKSYGAVGGCLVMLWCLLLYAGLRRIAMRRKFGMPGKASDDVCSWMFCAWAALCQEVRTLRHFDVRGGVWNGFDPARVAALAQEKARLKAPKAVEMV